MKQTEKPGFVFERADQPGHCAGGHLIDDCETTVQVMKNAEAWRLRDEPRDQYTELEKSELRCAGENRRLARPILAEFGFLDCRQRDCRGLICARGVGLRIKMVEGLPQGDSVIVYSDPKPELE